jgi:hypothetical protein
VIIKKTFSETFTSTSYRTSECQQLDFQISIFKLRMKSHALKAMGEPFDKNLVTKMWVIINNNTLLTKWLSEFLKLAKNCS